jgi:hypothetical protein
VPTVTEDAATGGHVSEGTNTKDEKAAYLAAVFKRMGELLGPLHQESYAHVDEVKVMPSPPQRAAA